MTFPDGPSNRGLIPGRVIIKTQEMVANTSLLKTQHYKEPIIGKFEQSKERISVLPYTLAY